MAAEDGRTGADGPSFYVRQVVAALVGRLVAGETVTATMIVAAAVILLGVAAINAALPDRVSARQRVAAIRRGRGVPD